jgi:hypothetical protein
MPRFHGRRTIAAALASLLIMFSFSGFASAHIVSKSILTEAGECATQGSPACGAAAVYGPTGFSGTITFSADEAGTTVKVVDWICAHRAAEGPFMSFGGGYTLNLFNGGTPLGSDSYTVNGNVACVDEVIPVTGVFGSEGASIVVPNDLTVEYTVAIAGVVAGPDAQATFAGFNSIRNGAADSGGGLARVSVKPPTDFIIPESPVAILIVLTGGLAAAWFVRRQMRRSAAPAAA